MMKRIPFFYSLPVLLLSVLFVAGDAWAAADADGDGIPDVRDACAAYANTIPIADPNADLIPSDCQCGDYNLDGSIGTPDLTVLFGCLGGVCNPPGLADTNNDGVNDTVDITNLTNVINAVTQSYQLTCPRKPVSTPPPTHDTSDTVLGVPVTAVGDAFIYVGPSDELVAYNIGSSGLDGFVADIGGLDGPAGDAFEFDALIPLAPPSGAAVVELLGSVNGVPGQTIYTESLTASTVAMETIHSVAMDFSGVGASTYNLQVFNGPAVMGTVTSIAAGAIGVGYPAASAGPGKKKCKSNG